jgi:Tol biopolymer transport system component
MKRYTTFITLSLALLVLLSAVSVAAQETFFGKNKVRYKDFEWQYIQTRHFDVYFYEDAYPTAKFTAQVLESSYVEISNELNYKMQRRAPIFLYNSHNDFQQTNITAGFLPEGVGGFTEVFKSRVVIPHNGSYEDLRHVLHHELVHAFQFDILYGNAFSQLLSSRRLFQLPLWFSEGMAEYSARHGWDYYSDMFMRDATVHGYLTPPQFIGGFLAYKQGQAMLKYIADTYGEDKIGEIMHKGKIYMSMDRALKTSIDKDLKEFWEDFEKMMKRRYWPEITKREEPDEFAKQLTKSGEDGSFYNEKPAWSPHGDKIAIYTDRSDYTEIILISSIDGKPIKSLVKSQRNGDLESLHSFVSGVSFSPDGRSLAFVAKSKGKESIFLYSLPDDKIYLKRRFDFYSIVGPQWSPDGKKIAFAALNGPVRDIYVWTMESDRIEQVTQDRYDDVDPTWLPNSAELIFSSDRPHPQNQVVDREGHPYVRPGAYMPGDFDYGQYNLFRVELGSYGLSPVDVGPGPNTQPMVSPDGSKLAFTSARNGADNLYVSDLSSGETIAVTNLLGGIFYHSWAPDKEKIAFSAFHKGRFDIFVLKDLTPKGEKGVLEPTDFVRGEYNPEPGPREIASTDVRAVPPEEEPLLASTTDEDAGAEADELVSPDTTAADATGPDDDTEVTPGETPDSTSTAAEPEPDSTGTRIEGDEFVFVSDRKEDAVSPLDSLMEDVDLAGEYHPVAMEEPAYFDSIQGRLPDGEYKVQDYKVKFTPDFVGGGLSYDTFFGLRGQTYFVFSDYLGNHQIVVASDLVNTIDQSDILLFYLNNKKRISFGIGGFHTKNFYENNSNFLFSDRFYGVQAFFSRPNSTFSRFELTASQYFIDRKYLSFEDPRFSDNENLKISTAELAYVSDNVIWGNTGPVNGGRTRLAVTAAVDLFDANNLEFYAFEGDWRRYWHFAKTFSMALRFSFGLSEGNTPKQYYLGGTTNWIGTVNVDDVVFEPQNLYFSNVITPLRGYEYYDFPGNRFGLVNWEFRFPLIQYFVMRFPLQVALFNVNGAIFADVGAAWTDDNFKGATSSGGPTRLQDIKSGFGFGMRANILGFILLRYDLAWSTDLNTVSDRPKSYFSLGADF